MASLDEALRGLLWSLWSELGVPGRERRHQTVAIDPEPVIVWTPLLAASDPRLLGLVFDWCAAHAEQVAKTRLTGLTRQMPKPAVDALAAFNGALAREKIDWRPRAKAAELHRERRKMALPTERPALVRFRVRALCGSAARAEVLTALLASQSRGAEARSLTPAGLTRRSVERQLTELVEGQLVSVQGGERRRVFRLRDQGAFERLVRGGGLRWVDWHEALALAASLRELAGKATLKPGARRVEASREWRRLTDVCLGLSLEGPPGTPDRPDVFEQLLAWGARTIAQL
jgi:hypothetical protein